MGFDLHQTPKPHASTWPIYLSWLDARQGNVRHIRHQRGSAVSTCVRMQFRHAGSAWMRLRSRKVSISWCGGVFLDTVRVSALIVLQSFLGAKFLPLLELG
ncbi:hypothetical protein CVS27_10805 [Arthrobacter glacialis]|uniref:Uncharacterized protein n=1 Tax=Arthrobacter glacialis TaxID=1664 RepID=A0A2S3ZWD7_ARTGL|nr:hypothetical protein CVS27_10805 [Arthrobacter glacialis]